MYICIYLKPISKGIIPQQSLFGPASKAYPKYVYLLNSSHMVYLSWLNPIMYTIKFRISIKYQFNCNILAKN